MAVTIIAVWLLSCVGAVFTKDGGCFSYALFATLLLGFGYLWLHG
jgi:hypothetical protein